MNERKYEGVSKTNERVLKTGSPISFKKLIHVVTSAGKMQKWMEFSR